MSSRISAESLSTARMRALSLSLILVLIVGIIPVGVQDAFANTRDGALHSAGTQAEGDPAAEDAAESSESQPALVPEPEDPTVTVESSGDADADLSDPANDQDPAEPASAPAESAPSASSSSADAPLTPASSSNWEREPNNNTRQANTIKPGVTYSGSSSGSSYSDFDYFAIDVSAVSSAKISFTFPKNLGGNKIYTVAVYDSRENRLYDFKVDSADADGMRVANLGTHLPKGRAYIEVRSDKGTSAWGKTFRLRVDLKSGKYESEDNGRTSSATSLPLAETYSGSLLASSYSDHDYYGVDLAKPATVRISVRFPSGLGGGHIYRLSVLDPRENTLRSERVYGDQRSVVWTMSLPKGQSYIVLAGDRGQASWGKTYTLNVSKALSTTPTPTISGTAHVGKTLKAKPGTWKPSGVSLSYQWKRGGKNIKGATKSSYKVVKADVGKKITVSVTGSKSGFGKTTKTSKAKSALDVFTTAPRPTVSGTAKVGKTLTAKPGTWKPGGAKFAYQWKSNGKNIKGATKSSYKIPKSQKGKKITVAVTGSKKNFAKVTKTSTAKTIR